ncbi:hypothetical protein [Paenibacillus sp. 481]|uniref:hypothetical protein n=1 Tax=Paenibacillus sp. 481 TaxID=2835869 RepID=UPI001E4067B2|nr:hypothetical protein [Paenibacillus sp. 481]UHA72236.1 hypothetical protein KIK04_16255 [Paenibacillus sp. 481]
MMSKLSKMISSPLFTIIYLVTIGAFILLMQSQNFVQQSPALLMILRGLLIVFAIAMIASCWKRPLSHFFLPLEFREEDEGQQWITYRACRKVYIYYYVAIPVAIIISLLFSHVNFVPLLVLFALAIGQFFVYWLEIRKLDRPTN